MLEELQTWWQNLTPENLATVQTIGSVVVVIFGGHIVGSLTARSLRGKNFDAALRLPGSAPAGQEEHGITPTFIAGMLVRLTVWAGAAWWLAHKYERVDLANTIGLVMSRAWAVAGMLVTALGLGRLLAQRLIDCMEGPKSASDGLALRNGAAGTHRNMAGAVGAGAYVLVVLLVLLMAADFFGWQLTRNAAQALWQLAQHLLLAGSALGIGYLGARAARNLAASDGTATPEKRAGQYTAVGIVAATTVLAVGMLLSSTGVLVGLAALAVLGFALWLVRGHLPDLSAGLQLRVNKVREVWFDDVPWQVADVGLLKSNLCRNGEVHAVRNHKVLAAQFQGTPAEAASVR